METDAPPLLCGRNSTKIYQQITNKILTDQSTICYKLHQLFQVSHADDLWQVTAVFSDCSWLSFYYNIFELYTIFILIQITLRCTSVLEYESKLFLIFVIFKAR